MKTKSRWISWRLVSALLALPLLGMTVPAFAAAPPAVSVSAISAGTNLTSQLTEALAVGQQIEGYLQVNLVGQVTLSPAAASGLSAQTLAVAESGIDQLNVWISEGAYQVSEVNGVLGVQQGPNFDEVMNTSVSSVVETVNPNGISKYGNTYWISLTQSQTESLITAVEYSGYIIGILIGLAGGGILGDVAGVVATALIEKGASALDTADRLGDYTGLTIIYQPPSYLLVLSGDDD